MPPKNNKKLRERAKRKMLVTSRLMAISLLVDDYIYKNKPISLLEAMKFDEEITSLKLKCEQDTRSLQVIEKLKIFMKSIIKEQTMDKIDDNASDFVTNTCGESKDLIVTSVISENVDLLLNNDLYANNTTELNSNSERQNSEINKSTQDINMQTKISTDIISPGISGGTIEIKQIESNDITTNSIKVNDKSEENITYISNNIHFDKDELLFNATNKKEQAEQDLVTIAPPKLQKQPDQICIIQQEICSVQKNKKPKESRNKEKPTKVNKKKPVTNKIVKNNIQTKTKKITNNSKKELEKMSPRVKKSMIKTKEKKQIDFTWVENIQYVREISPDERTDLQIDDSFWSDSALPGSWNFNDFD